MRRVIIPVVVLTLAGVWACKPARPVAVVEAAETPGPAEKSASAEKSAAATGPPAFADDSGGRLLVRILVPQASPRLDSERRAQPLSRSGRESLERPEIALAPPLTTPISLPARRRTEPRPWLAPDLLPLSDYIAEPVPPQRLELPPGERIRTPSRDVNLPIDLPVQGKYQPDRAPLDDPTADYSLQRSQGAALPLRDKPAPFVRVNLPEPFEYRTEFRSPLQEPPIVAPPPRPPK